MRSVFKINFKRIQSDFIYNTIQQTYDYILDTLDMKKLIKITKSRRSVGKIERMGYGL